jgi:hypothetical protein
LNSVTACFWRVLLHCNAFHCVAIRCTVLQHGALSRNVVRCVAYAQNVRKRLHVRAAP